MILGAIAFPVWATQKDSTQTVAKREVSMDVKLVFLGIDSQSVQQQYLSWNLPQDRQPLTEIPGVSTDTTYSIKYDFGFASPDFLAKFTSYLKSIAKAEKRTNVLWNETYSTIQGSYFLNYTHYPVNATNTYYSADQVESWLLEHAQEYGGSASAGYTLMVADLSGQLPSVSPTQFEALSIRKPVTLTPHFYNKTYVDNDLGIKLNRRYMTAWGGHSRIFFIDLSAGPGSAAEQLPLQLAAWINRMKPSSPYWSSWLTQYVGDYISGAVYNIFLPDFIYPLNYAQTYRFKIFVLDNRTDPTSAIETTVDQKEIRTQLSALVPFANVEVNVTYLKLSDYPDLFNVVKAATSPSLVGLSPIVDARLIYDWLSQSGQGNIAKFTEVTRNSDTYDIPEFVFAFDGDYNFGFTYKESIAKDVDFDRTIWGVSLYDMVLISHSANDFTRGSLVTPQQPGLGFGFTNTVIHESGHMLGLVHPFGTSYDPTENFVSSVMAYYPYEDGFSQFDKDLLLRGYADQLIRGTTELLQSSPFDLINWSNINSAQSSLNDAEAAYDQMNYTRAAENAFAAYVSASQASMLAGGGSLSGQASTWVLGVVSFFLGVLIAYIVLRRRTAAVLRTTSVSTIPSCSVCKSDLTWIQQYQRWYCYKCKRYE
jgi:hypothetical protein